MGAGGGGISLKYFLIKSKLIIPQTIRTFEKSCPRYFFLSSNLDRSESSEIMFLVLKNMSARGRGEISGHVFLE